MSKTVEVNLGMVSDRKINIAREILHLFSVNADTAKSKEAFKIAYAVMMAYVKQRRDNRDGAELLETPDGEL